MKKAMRMTYIVACYILSLPLAVFVASVWLVWMCVSVRNFAEVAHLIGAFIGGLKEGHKTNMHWVRDDYKSPLECIQKEGA